MRKIYTLITTSCTPCLAYTQPNLVLCVIIRQVLRLLFVALVKVLVEINLCSIMETMYALSRVKHVLSD